MTTASDAPKLRWEKDSERGIGPYGCYWFGFSNTKKIACAYEYENEVRWFCYVPNEEDEEEDGVAQDVKAAQSAAETAWSEFLDRAGLMVKTEEKVG